MTEQEIKRVFTVALNNYATNASNTVGVGNIVYIGMPYTPTIGTPYIKMDFFVDAKASVGIGTNTKNRVVGFVQLTIRVPSNRAEIDLTPILSDLDTYFKRGTVLAYNNVNVRVLRNRPLGYMTEADWYTHTQQIMWRSDITN